MLLERGALVPGTRNSAARDARKRMPFGAAPYGCPDIKAPLEVFLFAKKFFCFQKNHDLVGHQNAVPVKSWNESRFSQLETNTFLVGGDGVAVGRGQLHAELL